MVSSRSDLSVRLATVALPVPPAQPPPRVDKAARPGLVRHVTLEIWAQIRAEPAMAARILGQRLRYDRSLGSKGRRTASAALYGLIRHGAALSLGLEAAGGDPRDPVQLLLAWLVAGDGLDPAVAVEQAPGVAFHLLCDLRSLVAEHARGMEPALALALGSSLPLWLAEVWLEELGEEAGELVAAFATRPPMAARVNVARTDRDALVARLAAEGVCATPGALAPQALIFSERRNVHALPSFREGLYEIQDEGSQLLAGLVGARPGLRVVDLCAGAGGKSLALADAGARVVALDVRTDALRVLERRMGRAGQDIRFQPMAEQGPVPVEPGWADVVLVDAPCSSSGVLRRHPELRWVLTRELVAGRAALQRRILERAVPLVRPGARLVYGTCSLLRAENQEVLEGFLGDHRDFSVVARLGDGGVLWPQRTGTDGFFGVAMVRG
ncbi:MAG: RsmB/NOP family class I SAM-dependent RNA methyltransferase [Pseudomonadota bacterium]